MIKRTIEISGPNTSLRLEHRQLVIVREESEVGRVPTEDIGILIVDTLDAVYAHSALVCMAENGVAVVLCSRKHEPAAFLMPVSANALHAQRLREQMDLRGSIRKRLWQQVVRHKIESQAGNLEEESEVAKLKALVPRVQLDDKTNVEARAARYYWPRLFRGMDFRRRRDGDAPNGLLNYGYMVLRAAVARAICGAGLTPALGIHHSNKYNNFCLADDLVEALRPLVDRCVRQLVNEQNMNVNQETKRALLGLLSETVYVEDSPTPLLIGVERMVTSLVRCIEGARTELLLPELWR